MKQTEAGAKLLEALENFTNDEASKERYKPVVFSRMKIAVMSLRADTLKILWSPER